MGYEVVPEVGCSGYRIDIGVVDPVNAGSFLLGVECDGATYKSSSSARDRDRLREQVLRQLGWRIHRIWSPAWVARRDSEIRRLKETLEQAQKTQLDKDAQKPIIDIKEGLRTTNRRTKKHVCRHRKNRCPLQSLPPKSHLQPLHQSCHSQNHHRLQTKKRVPLPRKPRKPNQTPRRTHTKRRSSAL